MLKIISILCLFSTSVFADENSKINWIKNKIYVLETKTCFESILLDWDSAKIEFTHGSIYRDVEGRINAKNQFGAYSGWIKFLMKLDRSNNATWMVSFGDKVFVCQIPSGLLNSVKRSENYTDEEIYNGQMEVDIAQPVERK